MLNNSNPTNTAITPIIPFKLKLEPKINTEIILKTTKLAENIAATYPGLGAVFIAFKAKTVAPTENNPITVAITIDFGAIENWNFGKSTASIAMPAAK